jgi:ubiquinone/menaquinone biosynthesis C-methylase UbiE
MMDAVSRHGDKRVLDVGCGNDFLLFEAAKHMMTSRTAAGSYVWTTDGGEQSTEVAWRNAHLEGVADRRINSADARAMPFGDNRLM